MAEAVVNREGKEAKGIELSYELMVRFARLGGGCHTDPATTHVTPTVFYLGLFPPTELP
jgi:hypothetical protein